MTPSPDLVILRFRATRTHASAIAIAIGITCKVAHAEIRDALRYRSSGSP